MTIIFSWIFFFVLLVLKASILPILVSFIVFVSAKACKWGTYSPSLLILSFNLLFYGAETPWTDPFPEELLWSYSARHTPLTSSNLSYIFRLLSSFPNALPLPKQAHGRMVFYRHILFSDSAYRFLMTDIREIYFLSTYRSNFSGVIILLWWLWRWDLNYVVRLITLRIYTYQLCRIT
jgi:hypothetical protein